MSLEWNDVGGRIDSRNSEIANTFDIDDVRHFNSMINDERDKMSIDCDTGMLNRLVSMIRAIPSLPSLRSSGPNDSPAERVM